MNYDNMKRAVTLFVAVAGGVATVGCGTTTFVHESTAYIKEVAAAERANLDTCTKHQLGEHHDWDHLIPESGEERDCYLAVVNPAGRVILTPPKQPADKPKKQDLAEDRIMTSAELARINDAPTIVGQVAWPAMLSRLVYRDYLSEPARNGKDVCLVGREWDPLERLNRIARRPAGTDRWETWWPEGLGCFADDGLFYETFVYRQFKPDSPSGGVITRAFIVFRGTENFKGAWRDDWETNLSMTFGTAPGQFRLLSEKLPALLTALQSEGGSEMPIYTAGHSLGGGLAQAAAYLDGRVRAAYTFDTSPVTAWTWLRKKELIKVQDPQIIRVSNDYEALSLVRKVTNAANSAVLRTGRVDVTLTFPLSERLVPHTKSSFIKRAASMHSMALLACNLSARVALGAPTAFSYPKEMAKQVIVEQEHDMYVEPKGSNVTGLCEIPALSEKGCTADWVKGTFACKAPTELR